MKKLLLALAVSTCFSYAHAENLKIATFAGGCFCCGGRLKFFSVLFSSACSAFNFWVSFSICDLSSECLCCLRSISPSMLSSFASLFCKSIRISLRD